MCLATSRSTWRVVVLGGGTGTQCVLSGLRHYPLELASIVSVMDSGGSSGRLRDEYGVLPPGDARQCLVALASNDDEATMLRALFTYRFHGREQSDGNRSLDGHNLGNLFISALSDITGSTETAYSWAGRLLNARGRVIPVSTTDVHLNARLTDGYVVHGEAAIDVRREHPEAEIDYVFLDHPAYPTPSAVEAIRAADLVVIGPGDLYTSIVPNLLVSGIPEALAEARGCAFVVNLMTKRGETDKFASAATFVERLGEYLSPATLDAAIVNTAEPSVKLCQRYAAEGAQPVVPDLTGIEALGVKAIAAPVLSAGWYIRHDPRRLAAVLMGCLEPHPDVRGTPSYDALELLVPAYNGSAAPGHEVSA
jgi:uncharacterized cofD-like protein